MGRNKRLRKRVAGEQHCIFNHCIAKHSAWIEEELAKPYPDRRGIPKWEKDIARHEAILATYQVKLSGGS